MHGNYMELRPPRTHHPNSVAAGSDTVSETTPMPSMRCQLGMQLVVAMGEDLPFGSQESLVMPPQSPCAHTWEETTLVKGKPSGFFVLHMGSSPQPSPMCREPSNNIVNWRRLEDAIGRKIARRQRRQGGVKRRSDHCWLETGGSIASTAQQGGSHRTSRRAKKGRFMAQRRGIAIAPRGWEALVIEVASRNPILTRTRINLCRCILPSFDGGQFLADARGVEADTHFKVLVPLTTELSEGLTYSGASCELENECSKGEHLSQEEKLQRTAHYGV